MISLTLFTHAALPPPYDTISLYCPLRQKLVANYRFSTILAAQDEPGNVLSQLFL
tara:strand:- start:390 stop:554 length:165 start_codon:yes stop_codon:yes gene_type:complete